MNHALKTLGAGLVAMAMATAAVPASAKDGKNAALLGGLAAGVLVGGVVGNAVGASNAQQAEPDYEEPRPVVRRARPVYREPVEDVSEDCHFERRKTFDEDGNPVGTRKVRVCD